MKSVVATALAATMLAPLSAAPPATPAAPVSALVAQVKIPYEQFTLANGLRVIVHTDRKVPLVAISVWYHIGSRDEPKGKTGFAHLYEHLMFYGSENAPGPLFSRLEAIGATDLNGTTWFDRTNYFETVPTGALDRALFLESDRMGHLLGAMDQTRLDAQRGVVQNEKRMGENEPGGLTEYAELASLFPEGHPYRHSTIGSMADLNGASLEDVKGWFRDHYGPNNAVLVLAGDIDAATAKAKVEKWFGAIPRGPETKHPVSPVPTLPAPIDKVMHDRVATVSISREWTTPGINDPESTQVQLAAFILGGLGSSRLQNILVRQEKLAVSVSANVQQFEQVGILEVKANVRPGVDPAQVSKRLDEIIADYLKTGPSADELQRAATTIAAGQIRGLEQVGGFGGKAVTLAEGAVYSNDPDHYQKELKEIAAATPAGITAVARKWMGRPAFRLTLLPGERTPADQALAGNARPGRCARTGNSRSRSSQTRPKARDRRAADRARRRPRLPEDRARDPVERRARHLRPARGPAARAGRAPVRCGQCGGRQGQARHAGAASVADQGRYDDAQFDRDRRGTGTTGRRDQQLALNGQHADQSFRAEAQSRRLAGSAGRHRPQSRARAVGDRAPARAPARPHRHREDPAPGHRLPHAAASAVRHRPSLWRLVHRIG
jgi:predicted Zn-dependent peptidase